MATLITRLYDNEKTASKVVAALSEKGVPASSISVVTSSDGLVAAGLTSEEADNFAQGVGSGNAMLACRAPLGMANMVEKCMAATKAVDDGFRRTTLDSGASASSQSLDKSSLLRGNRRYMSSNSVLPISREGTIFSSRFGLKALSSRMPSKNTLMPGGKRIFPGKTLSSWSFGSTVSSKRITEMFGWPMLSSGTKTGAQLQTENTTPFSAMMGWRTIIRREMS